MSARRFLCWTLAAVAFLALFVPRPILAQTPTGTILGNVKDAQGAVNATEGFSIVLCELKILLETGRPGQLVRDKAALIAQAR